MCCTSESLNVRGRFGVWLVYKSLAVNNMYTESQQFWHGLPQSLVFDEWCFVICSLNSDALTECCILHITDKKHETHFCDVAPGFKLNQTLFLLIQRQRETRQVTSAVADPKFNTWLFMHKYASFITITQFLYFKSFLAHVRGQTGKHTVLGKPISISQLGMCLV